MAPFPGLSYTHCTLCGNSFPPKPIGSARATEWEGGGSLPLPRPDRRPSPRPACCRTWAASSRSRKSRCKKVCRDSCQGRVLSPPRASSSLWDSSRTRLRGHPRPPAGPLVLPRPPANSRQDRVVALTLGEPHRRVPDLGHQPADARFAHVLGTRPVNHVGGKHPAGCSGLQMPTAGNLGGLPAGSVFGKSRCPAPNSGRIRCRNEAVSIAAA